MIHERASAKKLAAIRIVLFATLSAYVASVPGERLAFLPPNLHEPVGFARLLPLAHSHAGILALRWWTFALLLAAAVGLPPFRWLAGLGMLSFTTYVAILHPGHRELSAIYLGYALAVGPSVAAWRIAPRAPLVSESLDASVALTLQVASFVLLATYSAIGVERLLCSAPQVFFDDSIVWHVAANSGRNGSFGFTFGYALLERFPWCRDLLAPAFLLATMFEALAPLALFLVWFRRAFVVFALGFHAVNLLLLNIEFVLNALVVVLLLVDWSPDGSSRAAATSPRFGHDTS